MQRILYLATACLLLTAIFPTGVYSLGVHAGTPVQLTADAAYSDGSYCAGPVTLTLTVLQIAGVLVESGLLPQSSVPGQASYVPLKITNTGNGIDTINLFVSSGSGWSTSFVRDDNGNGIHEATEVTPTTSASMLTADGSFRCFAKVMVPTGAATGDIITITAASTFRPTQGTVKAVVNLPSPVSPHSINFTAAPSLNPSAVASAGTTQCSATAADSSGHAVNYSWSDGGAGGMFAPSAVAQNVSYTARANTSGSDVTVTLTCTTACSQNTTVSRSASTALTVKTAAAAPTVLSVYPANGSTGIMPDTQMIIKFDKAMDHKSTELAVVTSPALDGLVYVWSADSKTLTITHNDFTPSTIYTCAVTTYARDTTGASIAKQYPWTFTTVSGAMFDPNQIIVQANARFATPHIVLNDPANPSSVTLFITVPTSLTLDTTSVSGSLVCIQKGSGVGTLTSTWDSQAREIAVTATIPTPGSNVEIIKSITLTAGTQAQQLLINDDPALTISVRNSVPGDLNGDGSITMTDLNLFNAEWARWHKPTLPIFSPGVDSIYDLSPHTAAAWPYWVPIGDKTINIGDATSFIEACVRSANINSSYGSYVQTSVSSTRILVALYKAPNGMFQANVVLPYWAKFNTATNTYGNLVYVQRQSGAGSIFFSEYDPRTRTVRITANTVGNLPNYVAAIYISM